MISRVLRTIAEHQLLHRGDRVLVAVSGGPDSTALLDVLVRLAPRLGLGLEAACVDHGLRPEAAQEAAVVAERCRATGIVCHVVRVDVRALRTAHVSWQDAARRARLGALQDLARERGCTAIALGHTADDQAETVLFRIVRGTGLAGLAGIPYRRGVFVRPLLDVRRAEVLAHLRRRRLSYVEDPSNRDPRFARSRVRHAWLPFLERENPRIGEALVALAAEARARVDSDHAGRLVPGLNRRAAATVRRLVASRQGTRRVSVAGGEIEVSYGRVMHRPRDAGAGRGATRDPEATGVVLVEGPGVYRWPPDLHGHPEHVLEVSEQAAEAGPSAHAIVFDRAAVAWPLVIRAPRPGDRLRPRGGRGSRKVSDLLIDAKVPRPARARLPVLAAADGTILFVPGLRPADTGRPGPATRRWLEVRVGSAFVPGGHP